MNTGSPPELSFMEADPGLRSRQWQVLRTREVVLDVEYTVGDSSCASLSTMAPGPDNDEQPLRQEREWGRVGYHGAYHTRLRLVPDDNQIKY